MCHGARQTVPTTREQTEMGFTERALWLSDEAESTMCGFPTSPAVVSTFSVVVE